MAYRERHDGWTAVRTKVFLDDLTVSGDVRHACGLVGISSTSAYRHRRRSAKFDAAWRLALERHRTGLRAEVTRRAIEGGEEVVIKDGQVVMTRRKPSDAMLKLALQVQEPETFGAPDGRRRGVLTERDIARIRAEAIADHNRVDAEEDERIFQELRQKFQQMQDRLLGPMPGAAEDGGAPDGSCGGDGVPPMAKRDGR